VDGVAAGGWARMIETGDLHKSYGPIAALRGVTLEAPAGQVTGLLGANGAGKSTIIRIITGYAAADRGWVRVGGVRVDKHPLRVRRSIGYLPESAASHGEMPVEAFLRFRASLYGVVGRRKRELVAAAMDRCRLRTVRRRRIGQLSKGYRQRVGLAAAIVHEPEVLILDEPANGLDPEQINQTRSLIGELAQRRTVLVSSHILPEIERTCDRVVVLARGLLCAQGRLDELLSRDAGELACEAVFASSRAGESARAGVASLEGVESVVRRELDEGLERWRVRFDPATVGEAAVRAALGAQLARAGAQVRLLQRESRTLEGLFLRLTEAGQADQAGVAGEGAAS